MWILYLVAGIAIFCVAVFFLTRPFEYKNLQVDDFQPSFESLFELGKDDFLLVMQHQYSEFAFRFVLKVTNNEKFLIYRLPETDRAQEVLGRVSNELSKMSLTTKIKVLTAEQAKEMGWKRVLEAYPIRNTEQAMQVTKIIFSILKIPEDAEFTASTYITPAPGVPLDRGTIKKQ